MDKMKKLGKRMIKPPMWHDCEDIHRVARITMILFIVAHLIDIALSYFGLWQTVTPLNTNQLRKSDHPLDTIRYDLLRSYQQNHFVWVACVNGWKILLKVLVLIGSWTKKAFLYWPNLLFTLFQICSSLFFALYAAIYSALMLTSLINWKFENDDQRNFAIFSIVGFFVYLVFLSFWAYFGLVVVNHSRKCIKHCR